MSGDGEALQTKETKLLPVLFSLSLRVSLSWAGGAAWVTVFVPDIHHCHQGPEDNVFLRWLHTLLIFIWVRGAGVYLNSPLLPAFKRQQKRWKKTTNCSKRQQNVEKSDSYVRKSSII